MLWLAAEIPMWAFLVAAASAETAVCQGPEVIDTAPAAGATDVPTDARLTLAFAGCGEARQIAVTVDRLGGDGSRTEVLAETVLAEDAHTARLFFDGGLQASTEYRVTIHEGAEIAFTTGDAPSEPLSGQLTTRDPEAVWNAQDGFVSFAVAVAAAPDPAGLSVIALLDPAAPGTILGSEIAREEVSNVRAVWAAAEQPAEACVQVVQWGRRGPTGRGARGGLRRRRAGRGRLLDRAGARRLARPPGPALVPEARRAPVRAATRMSRSRRRSAERRAGKRGTIGTVARGTAVAHAGSGGPMIALLAATAIAQADAAMIACEPMYVAAVLPEMDATGVPTDAVVTVVLQGDCGAPAFYDVAVTDPDGNVVASEHFDAPAVGDRLVVDPGGLQADTRYDVEVTPGEGWGEVNTTWFTTGDAVTPGLEGAPSASFQTLVWSRRDRMVWGEIVAEAVPDPAGAGWLSVEIEADVEQVTANGGGLTSNEDAAWTWFSMPASQRVEEVCATPVQIRVNGEEIRGDAICQEPEREGGPLSCATAASPTGLWPLALLLLARKRR